MAVLYITELTQQGQDDRHLTMPMSLEPPIANQTVAIGGGSVQSSAFNAKTAYVRVHCDAICSIEFGTNPTATVTTRRMAANATEYFSVPQNQSFKVAVIANT
jgi:hypothetical protein